MDLEVLGKEVGMTKMHYIYILDCNNAYAILFIKTINTVENC